jgi:uncharacterized damage-inducible protein DinB
MDPLSHISLMADYNAWMNAKVYGAAQSLSAAELSKDRGAFFGSILGTLNHIVVGDTIWLSRFARHPANYVHLGPIAAQPRPLQLDMLLYDDIDELFSHRTYLDGVIKTWTGTIKPADLDVTLSYANTKGEVMNKNFYSLLMHFFNHQTHHRGQVSTLLTQSGVDIGTTDLLALIPNQ